MTRLRWKLLGAMLAVVVATVGTSALLTRRVAHQEIRKIAVALPRRTGGRPPRAVVTDLQRNVLRVPDEWRGARVAVGSDDRITVIRPGARLVFRLAPHRVPEGYEFILPEKEVMVEVAALDRRLVITFAAATVMAVLLTLIMSRQITRPIELLNQGVNNMSVVDVRGRDEIGQLARSFNAMIERLSAQQELRRRMVGDVAHELRTPLTNLRCELEAIQDGLAQPDSGRIASIHEEVLQLSRLADDLQELAVAEAGVLQLQRQRIDLGSLVTRVAESFRSAGQAEVSAEEVFAMADPLRFAQIVRNLLSNAFRHARAAVRVTVTEREGEALVSVADDGPGIPSDELTNIFERFYRLDDARSRAGGGAGLGLAIVKQLVALHGGRVWAENGSQGGAVITVAIPSSALHMPLLR